MLGLTSDCSQPDLHSCDQEAGKMSLAPWYSCSSTYLISCATACSHAMPASSSLRDISLCHVQSLAKLAMVGYNHQDIYLHMAPLFHIGGISSALAVVMGGASHVFMPR